MATGQVPLRLRIQWRLREAARRWIKSTLVLLLAGVALSATSRIALDLLRWRGSSEVARRVADDPQQPKKERINAMVAACLDANATLEMLHRAAASSDPDIAIQGANGLLALRERSAR